MRRITESDRRHLFWWSPPRGLNPLRRENAGDFLSPVLIRRLLRENGLRIADKRRDRGRLFAIGSILHFARDGDVVWGAGINGKIAPDRHRFTRLDVRAVRGPLTRQFLRDRGIPCPEIYGDPALLLPRVLPELARYRSGEREFLVVPHLHDGKALTAGRIDRRHLLHPTVGWRTFVRRILESRLVLSSSLHGVIVAEAFGVPARVLRLSAREPLFKYEDYYRGTGRHGFCCVTTIEDGLARGGEPPPCFDPQALLEAFPVDLWME